MRWHSLSSLAASLVLAASGCVGSMTTGPGTGDDSSGGGDDTGGQTQSAQELYNNLQPQLQAECGSCHMGANLNDTATGPDFLGADASSSYDTLTSYKSYLTGDPIVGNTPENSKLYVYGQHTGPAMSTDLAASVSEWIIAQAEEDGITPPPDPDPNPDPDPTPTPAEPTTLVEALQMFSDCMTYTDFQNTNFQNVANQNTDEGQCYGCHSAGTGGSYLSQNDTDFYMGQRQMPYILKFVTGTVNDDGSFKDIVISRRYELKMNDNGHPNYIMSQDRLQSIQSFFDLTYARYRDAVTSGIACTPDDPNAGQ